MDFENFFDHSEEPVREAAKLLAEARDGLKNNQLTEEQFKEIAEDVVQIEQMEELADDLSRKVAIRRGAEALLSIVNNLV